MNVADRNALRQGVDPEHAHRPRAGERHSELCPPLGIDRNVKSNLPPAVCDLAEVLSGARNGFCVIRLVRNLSFIACERPTTLLSDPHPGNLDPVLSRNHTLGAHARASRALTSSTIRSIANPCANMIDSEQPSRDAASNSSARRRVAGGLRLRALRRRGYCKCLGDGDVQVEPRRSNCHRTA